jgi:hypothetical protein
MNTVMRGDIIHFMRRYGTIRRDASPEYAPGSGAQVSGQEL